MIDGAVDYDIQEHWLVFTERLGPDEYGAAEIVARDVSPWFGLRVAALFKIYGDAAKEYRDAEWALRILDGEGCPRLDPRWNAAVDRWRAADAALARLLGEPSPFSLTPTAVRSAVQSDGQVAE